MHTAIVCQLSVLALVTPFLARTLAAVTARRRALVLVLAVLSIWILPFHVVGLSEVLTGTARWGLSFPSTVVLVGAWILGIRWMTGASADAGLGSGGRGSAGITRTRTDRATAIVSGLVAASLAVFLANSLTSGPSGWDALVYHLPVAVRWLQTGSLAIGAAPDWRFALPGNFELTILSMLALGAERLATIGNWIAYGAACTAVAELAARLTHRRAAVRWTTLAFATLPVVQFQAFSGYLDLFGAALVLIAAALASARNDPAPGTDPHRWRAAMLVLSALSLGLAVGTKPTFWVYAVAAVIGIGALAGRDVARRRARYVGRALALATVVLALSSVFWFVRAGVATGNPAHPLEVEVAGRTLLDGVAPAEITPHDYEREIVAHRWQWLVYPWVEPKRSGYAYGTGTGLGALFATFVPMGLALGGWRLARDLRRARRHGGDRQGAPEPGRSLVACLRTRRTAILLLTLALGLVWWVALRRLPRFGLPVLALAVVSATPLLAVLDRHARVSFRTLGTLAAVVTLAISTYLPAYRLAERLADGRTDRAGTYRYPPLFDQVADGTSVWNLSGHPTDNYALAGVRLANRVVPDPWPDESVVARDVLGEARSRGVDLIVDRAPFRSDLQTAPGLRLVLDARLGEARNDHWRVWRVASGAQADTTRAPVR